uniref:Dopamine receptor 1-like n=1 Tax=Diabrotica virgifera virgifera TaxID=50390 RepID=A0A6P7GAZ7_DIAVI
YGRWVTRRVALGTIATIWLLAGLISFVPISLELHRPPQPLVYNSGGQNYPTCALDLTPTYAVVSSCISFYVPCIVMIGIYCRLYCYAQKHVKNIRAITRPIDLPDPNTKKKSTKHKNKALHIHLHNHHSSPYHVSDHKAAITVVQTELAGISIASKEITRKGIASKTIIICIHRRQALLILSRPRETSVSNGMS